MNIGDFLNRLERVRQLPDGQFFASCPTLAHKHGDRSAGLKIKETGDGKIILHCFSGCHSEAITDAMGLTLSDLFPAPDKSTHTGRRDRRSYISKAAWKSVITDAALTLITIDNSDQDISESDRQAQRQAADRLEKLSLTLSTDKDPARALLSVDAIDCSILLGKVSLGLPLRKHEAYKPAAINLFRFAEQQAGAR
jgi:hypothetical protein